MFKTEVIKSLILWIEEHLDEPLYLDRVAQKSGYSKWYIQRMFKDVTGESTAAYIRSRRLLNAAIALRTTTVKISDIAYHFQFDSQQSFSRTFKKYFHQSPIDYRMYKEIRSPKFNAGVKKEQGQLTADLHLRHSQTNQMQIMSHPMCYQRPLYWSCVRMNIDQQL